MDALPRSPTASRAGQIIVPTSPQLDSAEGSQREDDESNEADEGIRQDETVFNPLLHSADAGVHDASYSILPAPQRVEPSANLDGLYEQLAESSDSEESVRSQVDLEYQDGYDEDGIDLLAGSYRPAFRPPSIEPERASATIPTFSGTTAYTTTRREGQTSTSAILIQDSPTPPLRPLASPKARLAASNTGRCAALDDAEPIALSDADEKKTSLGELVCPVCLGPPTPLVVTECGHTL